MSEVLVEQLQALLPPVSYDPNGEKLKVQLASEAAILGDALASLEAVEKAIFPETAGEFIADWERVYGLTPSLDATQDERVLAVLAAMGDLGGQSIPYFIALAKRFGVTVTVDVNRPALTNIATVNTPATDGDALYEWKINAPLEAYRNQSLEAIARIRRPANTEVDVGYGKAVAERMAASADRLFNSAHYVTPEAINA